MCLPEVVEGIKYVSNIREQLLSMEPAQSKHAGTCSAPLHACTAEAGS